MSLRVASVIRPARHQSVLGAQSAVEGAESWTRRRAPGDREVHDGAHQRRRRATLAGASGVGILIVLCLNVGPLSAQAIVLNPLSGSASTDSVETRSGDSGTKSAAEFDGDTRVELPGELDGLLRGGGVPDSLNELRLLEEQSQKVAKVGEKCTVGVRIGAAQGCGVIITQSGLVLTAAHVAMRPGKRARVLLWDGRVVTARTLGMNKEVDAGLLRIEPGQNQGRPWLCASPGTSKNLLPGMWCIATGHPGGHDRSRGAVTRVGRILGIQSGSIVTDCALIGGDSGGPLFDLQGRLIAIHSRIGNDVAENLHVPVDFYKKDWDRLVAGNSWGVLPGFKPVIGIGGNNSLDTAVVLRVNEDSPAEQSGIQVGDVITQFGDVDITTFESLTRAVADTMPGEQVTIWLTRGEDHYRVRLEIGRAAED
ncbi:MAG: S1C family serine protease [Planctomycetota bacterium]